MTTAIGIDLGTTNSVISRLVDGRPVPIEIEGSAIVPSIVLYLDDRTVVGREAKNLELQHPERTVRSAKRRMGTAQGYAVGGRQVSPEEVSAEVLKALKEGAERALGEAVQQVVITVPAYFDDAQRRATLRAGELAGLDVLRLLNEPTSASLVYDQVGQQAAADGPEKPQMVLIYDLGGGTFDVSILEVFEGVREVRATAGNTQLGGDDFDDKLVQIFLEEVKLRDQVDLREDPRAMARLRRAAEQAKIGLSSDIVVTVREEFLVSHEGRAIHLNLELSRRDLEALIEPMLASTVTLSQKALDDAGVTAAELSRVCLVGGSTRIPRVRRLLEEAFGADIHEEIDVDLAVGLGASVQAGLLLGAPVGRILVDVTSHSLGMRVASAHEMYSVREADTFAPIIPRNTVLPALRAEEFYTMVDNQRLIEVEVGQGESSRASQNTPVGSFRFELEPCPEHSPVRVEFAYDLNGVVKVSIAQVGTSRAKTVALSVADAGAKATRGKAAHALPAAPSAVERKAASLIETLSGKARSELEALLAACRAASGEARQAAEDALLDFFVDHDHDDEDTDEDVEAEG